MTKSPTTPLDLDEITARTEAATEAWSWHEATDECLAGYGVHMGQLLFHLPADSQTVDMKTSIDAMVADSVALVEEVERLRDSHVPREQLQRVMDWRDDFAAMVRAKNVEIEQLRADRDAAFARAEVAEAKVAAGLRLADDEGRADVARGARPFIPTGAMCTPVVHLEDLRAALTEVRADCRCGSVMGAHAHSALCEV